MLRLATAVSIVPSASRLTTNSIPVTTTLFQDKLSTQKQMLLPIAARSSSITRLLPSSPNSISSRLKTGNNFRKYSEGTGPKPEVVPPAANPDAGTSVPLEDKKPISKTAKYRQFLKTYGSLALYTYISVSLINLGLVYLTLRSGFVDLPSIFFKQGLPPTLANASTFVLAYAIHKLMIVPRLAAATALVPILAQTLKKLRSSRTEKPK